MLRLKRMRIPGAPCARGANYLENFLVNVELEVDDAGSVDLALVVDIVHFILSAFPCTTAQHAVLALARALLLPSAHMSAACLAHRVTIDISAQRRAGNVERECALYSFTAASLLELCQEDARLGVHLPSAASGPHEHNAWGEVDVLLETSDRGAGLYRLHIAPGREIPLHIHRVMHECEMVLAVPHATALCDRFGRALRTGHSARWGAAAHSYANTARHGWCSLLCVDVPAFLPHDEIVVQPSDARALAGRDNLTYRRGARGHGGRVEFLDAQYGDGVVGVASDADGACNAGEFSRDATDAFWCALRNAQLGSLAAATQSCASIAPPPLPLDSVPLAACACGADCLHFFFPSARGAPPPLSLSSSNRASIAIGNVAAAVAATCTDNGTDRRSRTMLITCPAAFCTMPDACVVFAFGAHDDCLALVRHRRRGFELPGGKVNAVGYFNGGGAFESPEDAACRELLEETGAVAPDASAAVVAAARRELIADLTPVAQYAVFEEESDDVVDGAVDEAPVRARAHVKTVFACRLALHDSKSANIADAIADAALRVETDTDACVWVSARGECAPDAAVATAVAVQAVDAVPPPSRELLRRAVRASLRNACPAETDVDLDDTDDGIKLSPLIGDGVWDVCRRLAHAAMYAPK